MPDVFMRIMEPVEKQKGVNSSTPSNPASPLANLDPVLKKVSANIAILGKFVLVFKVQNIVLEEIGVGTDILSNMHIKIVLKVDTENNI